MHAASLLTRTGKTRRVSKLELRVIIKSMSEPITTKPQKRKEKPHKFKRNLLSPRYLKAPPPNSIPDQPAAHPLWVELAGGLVRPRPIGCTRGCGSADLAALAGRWMTGRRRRGTPIRSDCANRAGSTGIRHRTMPHT